VQSRIRLFISVILLLLASQSAMAENHSLLLSGIDSKKHALNEYIGHSEIYSSGFLRRE
jgi:hypothetical protein